MDRAPRAAHPGAQFEVFDTDGYRHTAFLTDQPDIDIAALELRHRHRARVEDAIRTGKETGMRSLPLAAFEHNRVWLELSLLAQELLCFLRSPPAARRCACNNRLGSYPTAPSTPSLCKADFSLR